MADAGFANIQPVITPVSMNPLLAGPITKAIRRFGPNFIIEVYHVVSIECVQRVWYKKLWALVFLTLSLITPWTDMINKAKMFIFRSFHHQRTRIERIFGILKPSYFSVGVRWYHSRHHSAPLVCNICSSLSNRRLLMFEVLKQQMGLM